MLDRSRGGPWAPSQGMGFGRFPLAGSPRPDPTMMEPAAGPHVRVRLRGPLTGRALAGLAPVTQLPLDYPGVFLDIDLSEVESLDEGGMLFLHTLKRRVIAVGGRIALHDVPSVAVASLQRCGMDRMLIGTFE